jgi:hypothetical protein
MPAPIEQRQPQYHQPGPSNPPYPVQFEGQGGADYGDPKQKRRRGNLPKHVTDILRQWFREHAGHPYPTEEEKNQLMAQTDLSMSQVGFGTDLSRSQSLIDLQISNWFINARRRTLPQMTRQAQAEQDLRDAHNRAQ